MIENTGLVATSAAEVVADCARAMATAGEAGMVSGVALGAGLTALAWGLNAVWRYHAWLDEDRRAALLADQSK